MLLRKFILQCGGILLAGHLISYWFFNYSPFHIPEAFPFTPRLSIKGLFTGVFTIAMIIIFEKRFLRADPEASIWDLTSMALLSNLASEIIFQLVRQFTIEDATAQEHLIEYLKSLLVMSLWTAIIAFIVAFQLKTKKVGWLIGLIGVALVLFNLMNHLLFEN